MAVDRSGLGFQRFDRTQYLIDVLLCVLQLSRALESQPLGDVAEQLMTAKRKTRERIEAVRQEEEREDLAETVDSTTDADVGRPPTGRSSVASPSSSMTFEMFISITATRDSLLDHLTQTHLCASTYT